MGKSEPDPSVAFIRRPELLRREPPGEVCQRADVMAENACPELSLAPVRATETVAALTERLLDESQISIPDSTASVDLLLNDPTEGDAAATRNNGTEDARSGVVHLPALSDSELPILQERDVGGFYDTLRERLRPRIRRRIRLDLEPPGREGAVFQSLVVEACTVRGGRLPHVTYGDFRAAALAICEPESAADFFSGLRELSGGRLPQLGTRPGGRLFQSALGADPLPFRAPESHVGRRDRG